MRAAGHPVRVWSYSPQKLEFLLPHGHRGAAPPRTSCREACSSASSPARRSDISATFSATPCSTSMAGCGWTPTSSCFARSRSAAIISSICNGAAAHKGTFRLRQRHVRRTVQPPHAESLRNVDRSFLRGSAAGNLATSGRSCCPTTSRRTPAPSCRDRAVQPDVFQSDRLDRESTDSSSRSSELADYLNDERVFGVHLWNARTNAASRDGRTRR